MKLKYRTEQALRPANQFSLLRGGNQPWVGAILGILVAAPAAAFNKKGGRKQRDETMTERAAEFNVDAKGRPEREGKPLGFFLEKKVLPGKVA